MKDFLGLKKVEKDLNKALSFDLGLEEKKPKKKQNKKQERKPAYTSEYKQAKKAIKTTGTAFSGMIDKIKNRKIIQLEKKALKAKQKADKLAHEIKTKQAISDSLTDIARYEKELEKTNQELKEREAQMKDPNNSKTGD